MSLVLDQQQTNRSASSYFGVPGDQEQTAQSFVPSVTAPIGRVISELSTTGSPSDSVQVAIYSDSSGSPGSQIGVASNSVLGSSIAGNTTFDFTGGSTLSNGTTYWIVYRRTGSTDDSNFYRFRRSPDDTAYSSGTGKITNDGVSWSATSQDMHFQEYYEAGATTTSTSSTSTSISTSSTSVSTSSTSTSFSTSSTSTSVSTSTSSTSSSISTSISTSSTSLSTSTSSTSISTSSTSTSISTSTTIITTDFPTSNVTINRIFTNIPRGY